MQKDFDDRLCSAARKILSGNWSMTAPIVPPKTIMAAVGWVI